MSYGKVNDKIKNQFLKEFGENCKKIRESKELTRSELSQRINGDENKIGRIERGEYDFKISSLLILANALEIYVEELINFKNSNILKKIIWQKD